MDTLYNIALILILTTSKILCSYEAHIFRHIILCTNDWTTNMKNPSQNFSLTNQIIIKTGLELGSLYQSSKLKYVATKFNQIGNSIDYFVLNPNKKNFIISYHYSNQTLDYKEENISLIAITNSIERGSLSAVYFIRDTEVKILNIDYLGEDVLVSTKAIDGKYLKDKNRLVKYYGDFMVTLSNNDTFTVIMTNFTIKLDSLIKVEYCFVKKIINFEVFMDKNQRLLIIIFTYLCADLNNLSIKLSHVFIDLQIDNIYKLKHIYSQSEGPYDGISSLQSYFKDRNNITTPIVLGSSRDQRQVYVCLGSKTNILLLYGHQNNSYEPYVLITNIEDILKAKKDTLLFPIFYNKMLHIVSFDPDSIKITSISTHILLKYNIPYYYQDFIKSKFNSVDIKQLRDSAFLILTKEATTLVDLSQFLSSQNNRINTALKEKILGMISYLYLLCLTFLVLYFVI